MTEYAYSFNEEDYTGRLPSIEAAIAEAQECNEEASECWIGEVVPFEVTADHIGGEVCDRLQEIADDECGEFAEDWIDLSAEQKKELGQMIVDFIDKHSPVHFFTVKNVVRHSLTLEKAPEGEGINEVSE